MEVVVPAAASYQESAPGMINSWDEDTVTGDTSKLAMSPDSPTQKAAKRAEACINRNVPWDDKIGILFTEAGEKLNWLDKACRITHAIKLLSTEIEMYKSFQNDEEGVAPHMSASRKYRLAEAINKYIKDIYTRAKNGDQKEMQKMCLIHQAAKLPVPSMLDTYRIRLTRYGPDQLKACFEEGGKPVYIKVPTTLQPRRKADSPKKTTKK
jgi:hypothetical protein